MTDFLGEGNLCGETLLRIVSRGNAILAELFRLSHNIPEIFKGESYIIDPEDKKYLQVLFDFQYLKDPDDFEKKVNESTEILDIDQEFQENHQQILDRFYRLFESIYKYYADVKKFVDDVNSGFFIQHTIDNILQDTDGKQLMCEAFYLFGAMLTLMDYRIPGHVREKMVIAFYRCMGETTLDNLNPVCKLCRSTGFVHDEKRPKNYPENFFGRFPFPQEVVRMVIGRLQSDDVYLQNSSFPNPEHRSARLANQAAILYIILYFSPKLLHNEMSTMREIVDKHFSDNWIISIYMGHVIDLSTQWAPYKAAKAALDNVLTIEHITELTSRYSHLCDNCFKELDEFLTEGILVEQFILDHINPLLNCLRKCNVTLRWFLMQRRTSSKSFSNIILGSQIVSADALVTLLLRTSQLEMKLKRIFQQLLEAKQIKWDQCKEQAAMRMNELSEYFTGEKALTRVKRDEGMVKWFASMANQINELKLEGEHATVTGRKIQAIIGALEEVEQFEQVETSLQIKAFLDDTRALLLQMIRNVNIQNEVLQIIDIVSDLSYAWEVINDYIAILHDRVKKDPSTVVLLRAMFLKLASILDIPLIRIEQCVSPDAVSVAEYYSGELVEFVRKVLDIIPISVFKILLKIVGIQRDHLKQLPIKLEVQTLKDYAQLKERYDLAKLTHQVSIFTEGILAMEKTLLGIIRVNPRQILEDGLRKELVRQISIAMNETLLFPEGSALEFESNMNKLAEKISAFRRSIEYVQDYVDLAGLKIWQEEIGRVINFNIELECNKYLKKKVFESQSKYQNRAIPIPKFPPVANQSDNSITFMGRVLSALIMMTNPQTTVHAPECNGWYTQSGVEICGIATFSLINQSIGVFGLMGLDRLLAFRIVHEFGQLLRFFKAEVKPYSRFLENLRDNLSPHWEIPAHATTSYRTALKKVEKLMLPMLVSLRRIGQAQLLRKNISTELNFSSRIDANLLHHTLETMNKAIMNDIRDHYRFPDTKPYPPDSNPLLPDLVKLLEASGISDPYSKIYITTDPIEGLPLLLLLFVIAYMPKLQYDANFATLIRRKQTFPLDGSALAVGIATLLKQFHPSYTREFLALIGQFIRCTISSLFQVNEGKVFELPVEVLNSLLFINMVCLLMKIPRSTLHGYIPAYVFDAIKINLSVSKS